jgi:arginine N-succinyltransferase
MTYAEADRLSKKNKEFIKGLFPEGAIYATLLPQNAQDVIGKVGVQTRGVERMLRRIGFRYAWRVDPFDGGPHFTAPTDEVLLVQRTHEASCSIARGPGLAKTRALVAVESSEAPFFRCVFAPWRRQDGGGAELPAEAAQHLGVTEGDKVWVLPIE